MTRRAGAGVVYMGLAALFFSLMSVLVKLAGARLPAEEIVLARVVVTLVMSYVLVRRAGLSAWGNDRKRLALRGLFGAIALACYYWTLTRLPLAEATTIHQITPLLTALLAAWLLRERIGGSGWIALAFGFAGVLLVARPTAVFGGAGLAALPVGVALAGACFSASAYVTVRQLAKTEHPLVIVFYFPLIALPLTVPWAAPALVWPTPVEWLLLAGVGVVTQIAQVFLTMGLHAEKAGRATAVGYLQVALAMGWGVAIFGEEPPAIAVAGAALIVGGTIIVGSTARAVAPAAPEGSAE